ncbi:MAG: hypothetical protein GY771_06825 [bacterium]|nr:hypothetical protein [bacterium]
MFKNITLAILTLFVFNCAVGAGDTVTPPERENLSKAVRSVDSLSVDESAATFKITLPGKSNVAPLVPALPPEDEGEAEGDNGNNGGETEEIIIPEEPEITAGRIMLYPSYLKAGEKAKGTVLPSLDMCGYKGLTVYEGGFASAQMKLEFGVGVLEAGKQKFLIDLANVLLDFYNTSDGDAREYSGKALVFIVVGVMLGQKNGELPPEVSVSDDIYKEAKGKKKDFEKEQQYRSSAFGFYHWSEDLQRLCVRDRWLSYLFWPGERDYHDYERALIISSVIATDPNLYKQHEYLFAFYSAVSNSTKVNSVAEYNGYISGKDVSELINADDLKPLRDIQLDIIGTRLPFQLLPEPSIEQIDLINRVVTDKATMSSGVLGTVISAIRAGQMDLTPDAETGYLGYSEYATSAKLNLAVSTIKGKATFDDSYNLRMETGMRTAFEQDKGAPASVKEGTVAPALTVEPLPDYYLRIARALDYLDRAYRATMGEDYDNLRSIRSDGKPVGETMPDEISQARDLFYGLYLESCMNLGLSPSLKPGEGGDRTAAIERARAFATGWKDDPDFARDIRYLYPVGPAKTATGKAGIDYLAVMGVRPVEIIVEYDTPPRISGEKADTVSVGDARYTILVPVVEEIVIPGYELFSQAEFIEVCDKYRSEEDIISALKRRGKESVKEDANEKEEKKGWLLRHLELSIIVVSCVFLAMAVIITAYILYRKRRDWEPPVD